MNGIVLFCSSFARLSSSLLKTVSLFDTWAQGRHTSPVLQKHTEHRQEESLLSRRKVSERTTDGTGFGAGKGYISNRQFHDGDKAKDSSTKDRIANSRAKNQHQTQGQNLTSLININS